MGRTSRPRRRGNNPRKRLCKANEVNQLRRNGDKILKIMEASGEFTALIDKATASNLLPQIKLVPAPALNKDQPSSVDVSSDAVANSFSTGDQLPFPELENVKTEEPEPEEEINCARILQLLEASGEFKAVFRKAIRSKKLLPQFSFVPAPKKKSSQPSSLHSPMDPPGEQVSFPEIENMIKEERFEQMEEQISSSSELQRIEETDGEQINGAISEPAQPPPPPPKAGPLRLRRSTPSSSKVRMQKATPSCFVCHSAILQKYKRVNPIIPEDCEVIFEDFLQIPEDLIKQYKKKFGPLQDWIPFCKRCLSVIREGKQLKQKINELQTQLMECKYKMVMATAIKSDQVSSRQRLSPKAAAIQKMQSFAASGSYDRLKEKNTTVLQRKPEKDRLSKERKPKRKKREPNNRKLTSTATTTSAKSTPATQLLGNDESGSVEDDWISADNDFENVLERDENEGVTFEEDESMIDMHDLNNYSSSSASKDPLSSNAPPHITIINVGDDAGLNVDQFKTFHCGLCEDFCGFGSEDLLQKHHNTVHLPQYQHQVNPDKDSMQLQQPRSSKNQSRKRKADQEKKMTEPETSSLETSIKSEEIEVQKDLTVDSELQKTKLLKLCTVKLERVAVEEPKPAEAVAVATSPAASTASKLKRKRRRKKKSDTNLIAGAASTSHTKEKEAKPSYLSYRYSCPNCPQVKNYSINRFTQHLAIHLRNPYNCSECSEFLPESPVKQEQHWKDSHGDKEPSSSAEKFVKINFNAGEIWKCQGQGCLDGFLTEEERNSHETSCEKISNLGEGKASAKTCMTCNKEFRNLADWRFHRLLSHPEVDSVSCLYCDETFAEKLIPIEGDVEDEANCRVTRNEQKMYYHLKAEHKELSRGGKGKSTIHSECEMCGDVFLTDRDYILHAVKLHSFPKNGAFPCRFCDKKKKGFYGFQTLRNLQKHIAGQHFVNRSESEIVCDLCGQPFKLRSALNNHKYQVHGILEDGAELINCSHPGCTYKNVVKGLVTRHFKNVHEDKFKKDYTCEHCGKGFKNTTKLNTHLSIHLNKETKPFTCELCGISFAVKTYLYIHKRTIHEKRKFPSSYFKGKYSKKKLKLKQEGGGESSTQTT